MDAVRATRIGALVGVGVVMPVAPFLAYAGVALANASAAFIQHSAGEGIATFAGRTLFVLYLYAVFGIPAALGGVIGARLASAR
jgi:hypothetical protein